MPPKMDDEPKLPPVMRRSSSGILKIDDETVGEGITKPKMRRNVSFTSLDIHEFDMELGDNPSAVGIPVQLGWEAHSSATFNLDTYERMKPRAKKRSDLILSSKARNEILKAKGTPRNEIRAILHETRQIKIERINSVGNMKWDMWEYQKEKIGRSLKKVATLGRSKSSPQLMTLTSRK